ncbi:MAG: ATP-binding protein [Tissierellia bacterium]|nr:ATP-binding protein [Tissierellia bacterium]
MGAYHNAIKKLERIRDAYRKENERRKKEIYKKINEIYIIDKNINHLGFSAMSKAFNGKNASDNLKKIEQLKKRKQELLVENGYPKDYLERKYHHKKCKDSGYVNGKICTCLNQLLIEERYNMSNVKDIIKYENFENFDVNLFSKNSYSNYDLSPRENIDLILEQIKDYMEKFPNTDKFNIFLFGDVGRGKTYLLNCLAKSMLESNYSVIYQTAPKLFGFLSEYYYAFTETKEKLKDKYDELFNCDILIIDDLGAEFTRTGLDNANLFEIVNERIINHKAIFISTNYDFEAFLKIYGKRITSRIVSSSLIFEIYGRDLRQNE